MILTKRWSFIISWDLRRRFETVNEEANEKVVFLKLGTLVVETYENHAAKMEHGGD